MIHQTNLSNLHQALSTHSFDDLLSHNNLNLVVSELHNVIIDYYNTFCPIKVKAISYKDRLKPWIKDSSKVLIRRRERYYVLCKIQFLSFIFPPVDGALGSWDLVLVSPLETALVLLWFCMGEVCVVCILYRPPWFGLPSE